MSAALSWVELQCLNLQENRLLVLDIQGFSYKRVFYLCLEKWPESTKFVNPRFLLIDFLRSCTELIS